MPRVSVILNCYNHEAYVAEAIESVLAQTFIDFELILIDNGSTDGSRAVLDRYSDDRIRRFYHDRNESLSRRLNEGVAEAKGEFVAVLYSDDLMLPDKLERQVAMFDALPEDYGVVYCPAIGFNQFTGARWQHPLYEISGAFLPAMFERHWEGHIDMSSPLSRRECFQRHKWYEDLPFEGEAIFMRLGIDSKFHFDPEPTVRLRDHDSNAGKAIRRNHEMAIELVDRMEGYPNLRDEHRPFIRRFKATIYQKHMWTLLRLDGNGGSYARRRLLRAIALDPKLLVRPSLVGGLILSSLPKAVRIAINRALNRMSHQPGSRTLVEAE